MGIDQIMAYRFPGKTMEDWKEKAEQTLKGKSIDTLTSTTYESIKLKPLYSKEDAKGAGWPGSPDFRRGTNPPGYQGESWRVAQLISWNTAEDLAANLADSFEKGQTAISFELKKEVSAAASAVAAYGAGWPFAVNAGELQEEFINTIEAKNGAAKMEGYITSDPVSHMALEGDFLENLRKWGETISALSKKHPGLRTVMIDTVIYHNGGANAAQELAAAAAGGVFYIEQLRQAGMELNEIFDKMIFKFAVGGTFFMEIAKLRAARLIWNRIGELYGADQTSRGMVIAAETSKFTHTLADRHGNLLRTGNEAFAAVLGGVDYLHVEPFDSLEGATPFSERIARNIQLILKEESQLDKVADPAGGSWFIENLTEQLAEKAWELFGKIDSLGGIHSVLESGWLQQEIASTLEKRVSDVKSRKQSIIGTNVYANHSNEIKVSAGSKSVQGKGVEQTRLTVPFEALRSRAAMLEDAGQKPAIGLICLGSLKESKPRADFIDGFLAPGGIRAVRSGEIFSIDDAGDFIEKTGLSRFCLCSSDVRYKETGVELLSKLKQRLPNHSFYLAGLPEDKEEWLSAGIEQFIHLKSNCYEFLNLLLGEMEAAGIDEKA